MGALADRIRRSKRLVHANETRARVIEDDVCRRLGVSTDDARLAKLSIDFASVAGGRRLVEVVKVRRAAVDVPFAMYAMKRPHGSEPRSAERAAGLGLGPPVYHVSDDGVIVEEFYSPDLNVRARMPTIEEYEPYGRYLAGFVLRFALLDEGLLLFHRDEREDHIFLLGRGEEIEVRLIDWGWATLWPTERMVEWAFEQFRWVYLQLSFQEPAIWTTFVAELGERAPGTIDWAALAEGYLDFARYQTSGTMRSPRGVFEARFLEFLIACGPSALGEGPLNAFVEEAAGAGPDERAELWETIVG